MGFTNFPHGITSFGVPVFASGSPFSGNFYVVAKTSFANYSDIYAKYGQSTNPDGTSVLQSSLQAAIDLCKDNRGDLILCFPGTESVTTAVLFNKIGIVVSTPQVGYNPRYQGQRFMIYGPATGPAAVISQPCVINGLGFSGQYTGAGSHNVLVDGTGGGFNGAFFEIVNCQFTTWGASPDYLLLLNGAGQALIKNCAFDGAFDGLNVGGIGISKSASGVQVWSCEFVDNVFISIGVNKYAFVHVAGAIPNSNTYKGNILLGKTAAAAGAPGRGKFLNNNGDTNLDGLVCDNWIGLATDTGSYDDTVSNLNGLGIRFAGNHYEE